MKKSRTLPILELKNITVLRNQGRKKILNGISLRISPGENTAVLGPNGAGKSSLMKLMAREIYPLADGKSSFKVWGKTDWNIFELRPLLGLVSNDLQAACSRDISGTDTVLSGFYGGIGLHGENIRADQRRKALQVLRFLEVLHLKDRKMATLSSGEARRFLIARALVHDPQALVLDEPFNSLDLKAAHHFKKILRKIARAGITILLVTHDLRDIIPEIKRVVLMKNGRIVKDGPKEKVLTRLNMASLYGTPVELLKKNGYWAAFAAGV